jgi:hypothetical protein
MLASPNFFGAWVTFRLRFSANELRLGSYTGDRQMIESQRDQFWRLVNARLKTDGYEPATNSEIDNVIRRTTCPRQAAEFVARLRRHGGPNRRVRSKRLYEGRKRQLEDLYGNMTHPCTTETDAACSRAVTKYQRARRTWRRVRGYE